MTAKWPVKPKITQQYDDFLNGFQSGEMSMHDAFMRVINEKEMTMTKDKEIEELAKALYENGKIQVDTEQGGIDWKTTFKYHAETIIKMGYSRHPASGLTIHNIEPIKELLKYCCVAFDECDHDSDRSWKSTGFTTSIKKTRELIDMIETTGSKPSSELVPLDEKEIKELWFMNNRVLEHKQILWIEEICQRFGKPATKNYNNSNFMAMAEEDSKPTPELPSVEELLRIIATVKGEQSNRDIAQAILSYLKEKTN